MLPGPLHPNTEPSGLREEGSLFGGEDGLDGDVGETTAAEPPPPPSELLLGEFAYLRAKRWNSRRFSIKHSITAIP